MSRATRCPACGTVFRVVPDQLKVSDGWVRCGRCAEVFDASQRMLELETAVPRDDGADVAASPADETTAETSDALGESADAIDEPAAAATGRSPAEAATPEPEPELEPTLVAESTPDFVRRAERAARRPRPARRSAVVAATLLAALLGAQVALHYRDAMAATWPAARPVLQAACGVLGCRVDPPRRIDSLHVDSSGLVRLPDSPYYRLSLVLRNKAPTAARMPAIELVLNDLQGHTVVRRVLTAAEFGHAVDELPAGAELALLATLDLGERQVAGYSVELFYP